MNARNIQFDYIKKYNRLNYAQLNEDSLQS